MDVKKTNIFYFSVTGGTAAVVDAFVRDIGQVDKICLNKDKPHVTIPAHELAVFAVPVYEGRVPSVIIERLSGIIGSGGPAAVIVVYGNRAYEDALIELSDVIANKGFVVMSAAAFIAEHSAYARLAQGRPDNNDKEIASKFGKTVIGKIASNSFESVTVKGNRPYRATNAFKVVPDCSDACTACGVCVEKCPQAAIEIESPQKTNPELCMTCLACIKYCPEAARQIPPEYKKKYDTFLEQFTAVRKEPELF